MDFEDTVSFNTQPNDPTAHLCHDEYQIVKDIEENNDPFQISSPIQEKPNLLQFTAASILRELDNYHEDIIERPDEEICSVFFTQGRNFIRSKRIDKIDDILGSSSSDEDEDEATLLRLHGLIGENSIFINQQPFADENTSNQIPEKSEGKDENQNHETIDENSGEDDKTEEESQSSSIDSSEEPIILEIIQESEINNKKEENKTEETQQSSTVPKPRKPLIRIKIPENYKEKTEEEHQTTDESQEIHNESSQESTSESSQDMSEPNDQISEEKPSGSSLEVRKVQTQKKRALPNESNMLVKDGKCYTSKIVKYGLKRWLYEHKNHPYPTAREKDELCSTFGVTRKYLDTFFRNSRLRQDFYPVKRKRRI
ncbi:hypothetical protein TVAG_037870 [Trichomonas vaginalis G3]|uniref:KN homeodomain domain-containing protein n=1 Tax=Trichomonas vaginalis (strain ATCC PRA-98 / G3) TaxID=412133 RepID=A2FZF2_TRIV3|nr:homeobox protein transcription factors family [Trichomonas vaginalis G3]EAX89704.1 hypothetical protein TVAG_037870 [Trichomonas vaginalis G3]KAI5552551.1 homeobox protein transcription factors family [Trichomonas vaginalis G3]|eukprot:XP_001302634.1 hypothetical protein [Trichomonas vaginalis G3]